MPHCDRMVALDGIGIIDVSSVSQCVGKLPSIGRHVHPEQVKLAFLGVAVDGAQSAP